MVRRVFSRPAAAESTAQRWRVVGAHAAQSRAYGISLMAYGRKKSDDRRSAISDQR
jgi:hypothetical protein